MSCCVSGVKCGGFLCESAQRTSFSSVWQSPVLSCLPALLSGPIASRLFQAAASGGALLGGPEGSLPLLSCHLLYPQNSAHEEAIFGYWGKYKLAWGVGEKAAAHWLLCSQRVGFSSLSPKELPRLSSRHLLYCCGSSSRRATCLHQALSLPCRWCRGIHSFWLRNLFWVCAYRKTSGFLDDRWALRSRVSS